MAAPYGWMDWHRYVLLCGVLLLGIYAIGWQVMLKRFNLGVAYANRSSVVIWGILLAWLCLGAVSYTHLAMVFGHDFSRCFQTKNVFVRSDADGVLSCLLYTSKNITNG